MLPRRTLVGGLLVTPALRGAWAAEPGGAVTAEPVTFMFPAVATLPAFLPVQLAQARGYYAANGLAVTFQSGRGGADAAKQVGAGNADLGLATADLPIIVRANGVPVRAVALLGGQPIFQLAVRRDRGVTAIPDIRGKKIGVANYQDASFYTLLGVMAAKGLTRADVQIQALEANGIAPLVIAGSADGAMASPEQIDAIESAGVKLDVFPVGGVFPAVAQGILASDKIVAQKPAMVRSFVQALLRSIRSCIEDPDKAAADYCAFMPSWKGREVEIARIERAYATEIYTTKPASDLGRFDPARMAKIAQFYLDNKIVQTAVPVEELYTNDFIG